jgi:hypothetical protein
MPEHSWERGAPSTAGHGDSWVQPGAGRMRTVGHGAAETPRAPGRPYSGRAGPFAHRS